MIDIHIGCIGKKKKFIRSLILLLNLLTLNK